MLVIDPEYRGSCFIPTDHAISAMDAMEKPNNSMKMILRNIQSIKKEINKKEKANIEKSSITFFPLNFITETLFIYPPRPMNSQCRLSNKELKVNEIFKLLK